MKDKQGLARPSKAQGPRLKPFKPLGRASLECTCYIIHNKHLEKLKRYFAFFILNFESCILRCAETAFEPLPEAFGKKVFSQQYSKCSKCPKTRSDYRLTNRPT